MGLLSRGKYDKNQSNPQAGLGFSVQRVAGRRRRAGEKIKNQNVNSKITEQESKMAALGGKSIKSAATQRQKSGFLKKFLVVVTSEVSTSGSPVEKLSYSPDAEDS